MFITKRQAIALYLFRKRRRQRFGISRRYWVHPLNTLRPKLGEHLKIEEMYDKYPDKFFKYTRLSPDQFDFILNLIENEIVKQDTNYRKAIPSRIRLFVTLRFLATGDSYTTIATNFSLGVSTVRKIVEETIKALWNKLSPTYMKAPTRDDWDKIIEDYDELWNFPNCLGAIDGKHVVIDSPANSGSIYHNYKGTFSIVLLATCDSHYRFSTVDIGGYGRQSDGGIFQRSALGESLSKGTLPIPYKRVIPNSDFNQHCTFIGDEAFQLSVNMMRPYPGTFLENRKRIFNYRLSRARRIIENCFGIMCNRFRIFRRPIATRPEVAINIVKATVCLHNYLRTEEMGMELINRRYVPEGFVDENDEPNGLWRNENEVRAFERLTSLGSN